MIKEADLIEAIAECQGERNPDARTCIKLAAYYTILNNISQKEPTKELTGYSRKEPPEQVRYNSGSEFSKVIQRMEINDILDIMDELMDTVKVLSPKLYRATISKLDNK